MLSGPLVKGCLSPCVHSWSAWCVWSRWAVAWTLWPPSLHRRLLTLLLLAATLSVCCGYCKLVQTLIDRYETRLLHCLWMRERSVCGWAQTHPSKEIFLFPDLGSGEPDSSTWPTFTLCALFYHIFCWVSLSWTVLHFPRGGFSRTDSCAGFMFYARLHCWRKMRLVDHNDITYCRHPEARCLG